MRICVVNGIQRPEIVCIDSLMRFPFIRRWIEELLQAVNGLSTDSGRGKRVGVADLRECQTAAFIGVFPGCCSVIEQTRRDNPFVIDDFSVRKRFCQTECAAIVLTAVPVQVNAVILIVGHTGTGICITESKHITPRAPCALAISAGAVVAFLIDAGGASHPGTATIFTVCDVIIVECGGQGL